LFEFLIKREGYIDNIEVSNLDMVITQFVLPRLKIFRKNLNSSPLLPNREKKFEAIISKDSYQEMELEWKRIIDKMILAFEYYNQDNIFPENENDLYEEAQQRKIIIQEGFELFGKYLPYLWE